MTVRRCLNEMANDGLLRRVHGGAVALNGGERPAGFHNRLMANYEAKLAIAEKAVSLIPEEGSVYLDGGTTCYAVAKRLAESGRKCLVITDSLAVVTELDDRAGIDTLSLGGQLAGDHNTFDGPLTAEVATRFSVDVAFVSACGFNREQLENRSMTGAMTKKVMVERSATTVCVADSGKFEQQSCFRFSGWDEFDAFITDDGLPADAMRDIAAKGVEVHVVGTHNQ
jgi:DeoR family fructose operon transcriptional repressor